MEDTSIGDGPRRHEVRKYGDRTYTGLCVEFPVQDRGGAKFRGRGVPDSWGYALRCARVNVAPPRGNGAGGPMRVRTSGDRLRAYAAKTPDASRPGIPARRRAVSLVTSTTSWALTTGIR